MRRTTLLTLAVLSLCVGGCSTKEAPMKRYLLQAPSDLPVVAQKRYHDKTVQVTYPESLKDKMNQKMYFSYSAQEQGSYLNSEWTNDMGRLFQGATIQTLERSGVFGGVISSESTVEADYRLESLFFDFSHKVRGEASDAVVSVQFALVSTFSGKLIKSKRFDYSIPTKTTDAKGYAEASNEAMRRLSKDLIDWLR